jgi:hypothetical protein
VGTFESRLTEIRNMIEPHIGQRFLREDVYSARAYEQANSHERLIIIKEIFAMYLILCWAIEGHPSSGKRDDVVYSQEKLDVQRRVRAAL